MSPEILSVESEGAASRQDSEQEIDMADMFLLSSGEKQRAELIYE